MGEATCSFPVFSGVDGMRVAQLNEARRQVQWYRKDLNQFAEGKGQRTYYDVLRWFSPMWPERVTFRASSKESTE